MPRKVALNLPENYQRCFRCSHGFTERGRGLYFKTRNLMLLFRLMKCLTIITRLSDIAAIIAAVIATVDPMQMTLGRRKRGSGGPCPPMIHMGGGGYLSALPMIQK